VRAFKNNAIISQISAFAGMTKEGKDDKKDGENERIKRVDFEMESQQNISTKLSYSQYTRILVICI